MKKKKTSTLNVRHTGHYQYEVNDPKRGATKTPATLDRVLTLTMNDILKYLNTRYLILVFAYYDVDRKGPRAAPKQARKLICSSKPLVREHRGFCSICPLTRVQTICLV